MKNFATLITALFLTGVTVQATTTSTKSLISTNTYVSGYGNSFIFVEGGIEFSVFQDGQFDFYMPSYGPNVSLGIHSPNVSISFNSGYDYNPYVQYDDFGAIIQIENVPIYYDYYGRISRAGNVKIRYNNYGRVVWVGGLHIFYNRHNVFSHYTGYINVHNRYYVYRPWHNYYRVPVRDYCVVYNRPYRQYYTPVRYTYYRPYTNNYRPNYNYIGSRRGVAETGRRTHQSTISERYRQDNSQGRNNNRITNNQGRNSRMNSTASRSESRRDVVSNQKDHKVRKQVNSTPNHNIAQTNRNGVRKSQKARSVNKSTNYSDRKPNVQKQRISSNERNNRAQQRVAQNKNRSVTQNKSRKTSSTKMSSSRANTKSSKPDMKRRRSQ